MPPSDELLEFRLTVTLRRSLQSQHNLGKARNTGSCLSQSHTEPVLENIIEPEVPRGVMGHTPLLLWPDYILTNSAESICDSFTWHSYVVLCFIWYLQNVGVFYRHTSVLRWVKVVLINLKYPNSPPQTLFGKWVSGKLWENEKLKSTCIFHL